MDARRTARFAGHHRVLRIALILIPTLAVAYAVWPTRSDAQGANQFPAGSPFAQSPADPGAVQFKDMTAAEKAAIKTAGSDDGKLDSTGWSEHANVMAKEAQIKRAEYEAGLSGYVERGAR